MSRCHHVTRCAATTTSLRTAIIAAVTKNPGGPVVSTASEEQAGTASGIMTVKTSLDAGSLLMNVSEGM